MQRKTTDWRSNAAGSWVGVSEEPRRAHDESILQGVLAAVPEPFFVYDENGTYLEVLGGVDRERYHDARHLIGKRMHDVMPAGLADFLLMKIRETLDSGVVTICEYTIDPKEVTGYEGSPGPTERRWFEAHISPIPQYQTGKRAVVWIAFDITELRRSLGKLERQRRRLRELARKDALTGLLNRRSFFLKANSIVARASADCDRAAWVLMMDLDHFKRINDTYGHHAGDFCLKAVASLLEREIRKEDALGRLGGEEFSMVIMATGKEDASELAERICRSIESKIILLNENRIEMTGSIGLAVVNDGENDIGEALRRADKAMYRAKAAGRNRFATYTEEMDEP